MCFIDPQSDGATETVCKLKSCQYYSYSYSTDDTCAIAQRMGAVVYQHAFENHARQFNWAMENCDIQAQWIWRLDADEYIEPLLAEQALKVIATVQ